VTRPHSALPPKELARRKRIAASKLSRSAQAERVGMTKGGWLCWLSHQGLSNGKDHGGRYPKVSPQKVADRLRIAALPISRGEQAKMAGLKHSAWYCWLWDRRRTHGDVPDSWAKERKMKRREALSVRRATIHANLLKRQQEHHRRLGIAARFWLTRVEQAAIVGISFGAWSSFLAWAKNGVPGRSQKPPALPGPRPAARLPLTASVKRG
jgi:hypothetical protein